MDITKRFFPFLLIFVLGFFAFKPLLAPGFFPMHDNTQVARVYEMSNSLADGMFPVRWTKDLGFGYGYPIFNFYAPLAYYIGGFINLLGVDSLDSTKLMMLLGIILSGFSMYLLAKEFFGKYGALFSSILYLYAPYHAVEIYVRGDVAEFFAYGFVPLVFYGLYKVYKEKDLKWVVLASVSYAFLILSHNLTAFMTTPFLIVFASYLLYKNSKKIFPIFTSFVIGIALSAFYWIPAIFEMKFTNVLSQIGGGADYKDHFVCISQLWTSQWGFGGSAKGCIDGISFMAGKLEIISFALALIFLAFVFVKKKLMKNDEVFKIILLFTGFLIISVFLMLDISKSIWQIIKPMDFFQYPWRFLIITEFCLSLVGGALIWSLSKFLDNGKVYFITIIFIMLIVVLNAKFFVPQTFFNVNSSDYTSKDALQWTTSKISSEYMPKNFAKPSIQQEAANFYSLNNRNISILSLAQNTREVKITLGTGSQGDIIFPLAYFPAWNAYIDREKTKIIEDRKGIKVNIPEGIHSILFKFEQTKIEILSNIISIVGLTMLIAAIIYKRKRYE